MGENIFQGALPLPWLQARTTGFLLLLDAEGQRPDITAKGLLLPNRATFLNTVGPPLSHQTLSGLADRIVPTRTCMA